MVPGGTTYSLSSVGREATRAVSGADPVWLRHCEHMPVLFVCSIPPYLPTSPQWDRTSEPKKKKKVSTTVPFVSGQKPDTEETSKQKKL